MNDKYKDFLRFRINQNLNELLADSLQETYLNIVDYSITLMLEDYFHNKIELSTIFENVPRKSDTGSINTNISKQPVSSNNNANSDTKTDPYGKIEDNSEIFKRMAIPVAGSLVGFGVREAGIRQGLFTGMTHKAVQFTNPEQAKTIASQLSTNYPSLLGNVKHVSDTGTITMSQDVLSKALASGEINRDMLSGGANAIGAADGMDNVGNMAAGSLTAIAASMATNMAINAIRRRIQKKREARIREQSQQI